MRKPQARRKRSEGRWSWPLPVVLLYPCCLILGTGCTWDRWNLFTPAPPPGPVDSLVIRGDRLEADKPIEQGTAAADLAGAHELFRLSEFDQARKVFHKIAENTKNPPSIAEEARYYEADCLRRLGKYPKACDTYHKMLMDFPSGQYREQAVQHMLEIANFWLDDTREEMALVKEMHDGKRWVVWPELCHWDNAKPFFDEEGRAIEALEHVRYNDMTGPTADKALFLCGSVKFYREDYREADHYFSQLVEMHPNSPFASQALELGIISKHMSTGGSDYDGRKVAEARQLVDTALRNYPELVSKKSDFLERQLIGITLQQAEKDYKIAEFYRRTGHEGSAYFYYEIVRRRYPGTKYCELALAHMQELRAKVEQEGKALPPWQDAPAEGETTVMPRRLPPGLGEHAPMPRRLTPGMPLEQLETTPAPRALPQEMLRDR